MNQHPHADILQALAEGEQIQDKTDYGYTDITTKVALRILSTGGGQFLRIKPKPFIVNGVECPRPVDNHSEEDLKRRQEDHRRNTQGREDANWRPCLHYACPECVGTGTKRDGSVCVHMISCPKCSPMSMSI